MTALPTRSSTFRSHHTPVAVSSRKIRYGTVGVHAMCPNCLMKMSVAMKRASLSLSLALLCIVADACQRTPDVIPDRLKGVVDRDLLHIDIKHNPEAYRGKLMLTGGKGERGPY